jgi:hypothetical protein
MIITVPHLLTIVEVDMAAQLRCITLAPGETLEITFDWTLPLGADRIDDSDWSIEQPEDGPIELEPVDVLPNSVKTSVWISVDGEWEGGCLEARLTNTIDTDEGLTLIRCLKVEVKECGGCGC